ncbi:MAG: hypothetical protein JSU92_02025 [Deltaproteobacteria bacterium]|nr:MAG: hypothetical protein JSU92_02025 [Deltaproteobacteria bacterium]
MRRKKTIVTLILATGLMVSCPIRTWAATLILTPDKKLTLRVTAGEGIVGKTEKKGIETFRLEEKGWAAVQILPDGSTQIKAIKGTVKVIYKVNTIFIPENSHVSLSLLRSIKRLKVLAPGSALKPGKVAPPILVMSGNASITLENGQGVTVTHPEAKKLHISVTEESIGQVKVTVCRTLARLHPRGEISSTLCEDTPGVLLKIESGIVDFIKDNGEMVVLSSGQTINDTCTPPPAEVLAVPEETVISPSAP